MLKKFKKENKKKEPKNKYFNIGNRDYYEQSKLRKKINKFFSPIFFLIFNKNIRIDNEFINKFEEEEKNGNLNGFTKEVHKSFMITVGTILFSMFIMFYLDNFILSKNIMFKTYTSLGLSIVWIVIIIKMLKRTIETSIIFYTVKIAKYFQKIKNNEKYHKLSFIESYYKDNYVTPVVIILVLVYIAFSKLLYMLNLEILDFKICMVIFLFLTATSQGVFDKFYYLFISPIDPLIGKLPYIMSKDYVVDTKLKVVRYKNINDEREEYLNVSNEQSQEGDSQDDIDYFANLFK